MGVSYINLCRHVTNADRIMHERADLEGFGGRNPLVRVREILVARDFLILPLPLLHQTLEFLIIVLRNSLRLHLDRKVPPIERLDAHLTSANPSPQSLQAGVLLQALRRHDVEGGRHKTNFDDRVIGAGLFRLRKRFDDAANAVVAETSDLNVCAHFGRLRSETFRDVGLEFELDCVGRKGGFGPDVGVSVRDNVSLRVR